MTKELTTKRSYEFLSSNAIKIIALITMTIDHMGMILFPSQYWMRYIGRLAYPMFAYMIGEGAVYTKNRLRYFLRLLIPGIGMGVVYYIFEKELLFNIFLTFSVSVALCTVWDTVVKLAAKKNFVPSLLCLVSAFYILWFIAYGIRRLFHVPIFYDGGLFGMLMPVAVYAAKGKWQKLIALAVMCVIISIDLRSIHGEFLCILSVIVIFFYNGSRGKLPLKSLFYVYYPAHIAVLYLLSYLM